MTTAARLDRTNIQPVLRHPVVASLRCIPIRIPLPSASPSNFTQDLHVARQPVPTGPPLPWRLGCRIAGRLRNRNPASFSDCPVVGRACPRSAVMDARQAETNQQSAIPEPRQHIGMVHWQAEHHLFRSYPSPRNRMNPCHPAAAMGSGRIHSNRPTGLGSDR